MPEQGFTIIELLITIAVAAILFTLVVPSFSNLLQQSELEQYAQYLRNDLAYAQQYARSRGQRLAWCAIDDKYENTCNATPNQLWQSGWLILDPQGTALRQRFHPAIPLQWPYHQLYIHPEGTIHNTDGQGIAMRTMLCHQGLMLGIGLQVYHGGLLRYDTEFTPCG